MSQIVKVEVTRSSVLDVGKKKSRTRNYPDDSVHIQRLSVTSQVNRKRQIYENTSKSISGLKQKHKRESSLQKSNQEKSQKGN